jgi:hypothetical protein
MQKTGGLPCGPVKNRQPAVNLSRAHDEVFVLWREGM